MSRKALLVGINNFSNISGLNGCVNDTYNVRDILKNYFKFENSDIRLLADNRATKPAILNRLNDMISTSIAGDLIIFHLSSHGSQIRDRNNDELADNLDELFCCCDMDWDDPGTFILDDDLVEIIGNLPKNVNLEVLLDTCHSGTGTRGCSIKKEEFPTRYRYTPPPPDIFARSEGDDLPVNKMFSSVKQVNENTKDVNDRLIVKMGHILWAGCKSHQTSADAYIKGSYNGAFTYYFCKHIRDANGKITRPELLKRIRSSLKYEGYEQVVQMETNKAHYYKEVFSNG
jgi:hypothetical protein